MTIARPRGVVPGASTANIGKPVNQPFKPPAFTARPKAVDEPPAYKARRMSPEPDEEVDEEAIQQELEATWAEVHAARAREGRTAVGFADLYEEARRENPGDRSLDPAPVKRSDPTSTKPVVPLAQRRSKWAVYVDGEAATKEEPKEEKGGLSGFAAAIQAAGESAATPSAPYFDSPRARGRDRTAGARRFPSREGHRAREVGRSLGGSATGAAVDWRRHHQRSRGAVCRRGSHAAAAPGSRQARGVLRAASRIRRS